MHLDQLLHYSTLEVEANPKLKDDPDKRWPSEGRIVFDNVALRYRPDLPMVLKGLSFDIIPGEKVSDSPETHCPVAYRHDRLVWSEEPVRRFSFSP